MQNLVSNWGAVRTIGRGEISQATFQTAVREVINPFAKEKTTLRYFYPEGWKVATVEEQLKVLLGFYPDLDGSQVVQIAKGMQVPDGADGLFVVPKPSSVAAKLVIDNPFTSGYGQLLEATVLAYLSKERKFTNYRAGELTADRLRMRQSAVDGLRKMEEEIPGDFLVIAAQTGLKWGGYSPRNTRWEMEHGTTEFPLPAWVAGHIILTNPKRLEKNEHLIIDCPGDEYRFGAGKGFGVCLYFSFESGRLYLSSRWLGYTHDHCGSGSLFSR